MSPLPATKIDETLELIRRLERSGYPASDFEMARLDSLIRQLSGVDKAASLSFRGLYHRLKHDYAQAERYHEASIQEAPLLLEAYHNFAGTLAIQGKHAQVVDVLLQGFSKAGIAPNSLFSLLASAFHAGRCDVIEVWLPRYNALTNENLTVEQLQKLIGIEYADISAEECYAASCCLGGLDDWNSLEEDEAWRHL